MALKVGVTSGIYYAARDIEIHSAIRKLGYTLTRGTASMEIAADVAHEVNFTQGREIRHIAKKQVVDLTMHGDLSIPICIPERGEWRDAHDRMVKSVRSAVFMGAKYVNFHACLNIWLELMTYAGRKLTMAFCDEEGKFISKIFKNSKETRDWFIDKKGDFYISDILDRDENVELSTKITVEQDVWHKEETVKRMTKALKPFFERVMGFKMGPGGQRVPVLLKEQLDHIIRSTLMSGLPEKTGEHDIDIAIKRVNDELREERVKENARIRDKIVDSFLDQKLAAGKRWYSEELRSQVGVVDGYHIMAHYLYWTQDPLWVALADEYKDVLKDYDYRTGDPEWLDNAWKRAEEKNDRSYKEFFYAAVGAKYLEGHLKKAFEWINGDFIKNEIPRLAKDKQEQEELIKIAKDLVIAIENPDAREPSHAGLYFLFRPRQIYAAIKTIRKTLDTDKVMILMDHEHMATQGIDALIESGRDVRGKSDFGALTISVHSNHPNPLHAHYPIELGDVVLYELLYNLRATGFGKGQVGYLMFERGGGQDPFMHSVDALKLMAKFLEKEPPVPVKKLPLEFFGMKGLTAGDVQRQMQIIQDHTWEPMKDLLEIPEEEWTMLSQTAIKKGKKPEAWKRGEFR